MGILYIVVMLGDGISRRIIYFFPMATMRANTQALIVAVLCSTIGFYMASFAIAFMTLFAAFLAFWGNGLCYGATAKYIDRFAPVEHNRAIYSLWCMIGDFGGIAGAGLVDMVNDFFCQGFKNHWTYVCIKH